MRQGLTARISRGKQLWLTWAEITISSSFSGLSQASPPRLICCLLLQVARGRNYLQTGCALQEPVETPALPGQDEGGAHQMQLLVAALHKEQILCMLELLRVVS